MCLFGLIAVFGAIHLPLQTQILYVDSHFVLSWGIHYLSVFSVPFSLGMLILLAFKAREYKQDTQNEVDVYLAYHRHISKEYIICIIFLCYLGLTSLLGVYFIFFSIQVRAEFGASILYDNLFLLLLSCTIFSLTMFSFLVFKAREYKTEKEMMKGQSDINAGLVYYKNTSQKHTACITLMCVFILGGISWLLSWLPMLSMIVSPPISVLDFGRELFGDQQFDWLESDLSPFVLPE